MKMASSTGSQTQSSSASEISAGEMAVPQYMASAAAAAPRQEDSLYEALLRYHQEHGSDSAFGDNDDDDNSDERYQRARQQQAHYTSGLKATTDEDYLKQRTRRQQQFQQQRMLDDDRKIPARQPSQENRKPPAHTRASGTHRTGDGRRMHSSDPDAIPDTKLLTPRNAKKPGIFHVKEPAIRSNSAMYVDAYGDGDNDGSGDSDRAIQSSPLESNNVVGNLVATFASEEYIHSPPLAPNVPPSYRNRVPEHSNQTQRNSFLTPLGPEEVRNTSANLKQTNEYHNHDTVRLAPPLPSREVRHSTQQYQRSALSAHAPMEPEEVRQTLQPLEQKKRTAVGHNDILSMQPSNVSSGIGGSMYALQRNSSSGVIRNSEQRSRHALEGRGVGEIQRVQQEKYQQTGQQHLTLPPEPSANRRWSGAHNPIDLMNFGSDEHIRSSREMERHPMRQTSRDMDVRGVSPGRSVKTNMSHPYSIEWSNMQTSSRRSSGRSVQSIGNNQGGEIQQPREKHIVAPTPLPLVASQGSSNKPLVASTNNHPIIPLHNSENHNRAAGMAYNHRDEGLYPATLVSKQNRSLKSLTTTKTGSQVSQRLPMSNPMLQPDNRGMRLNNGTPYDCRAEPHAGVLNFGGRKSSTSNDEDLELALQLSLQEANASENPPCQAASDNRPRGITTQTAITHYDSGDRASDRHFAEPTHRRVRNPYLNKLTESTGTRVRARHVKPSQFGQEAYRAAKHAKESDMDELMLALKISAEETNSNGSRLVSQMNTRHSSNGPSDEKPKETVHPSEQHRILQQIREEKERRDMEMALKASQEEVGRPVFGAVTSDFRSSETSSLAPRNASSDDRDATRDFLVSQQRAIEEYQRNRETNNAAAPSTSGKRRGIQRPSLSDVYRENLLVQGTIETQQAISSGRAHTVKCRKCGAKLQAPVSYSLVYCPRCETISPG